LAIALKLKSMSNPAIAGSGRFTSETAVTCIQKWLKKSVGTSRKL
jgi:hypothetical protein